MQVYLSNLLNRWLVVNKRASYITTYIPMEFAERMVHIKSMHVNDCCVYC